MEPAPNISEDILSADPLHPRQVSQRWWRWFQPLAAAVNSLTALLAAQSANKIFAGPAAGAAAVPTFRSLVVADGPAATFSGVITTAKLTGGGTNGSMTFVNGFLVSQIPAT